MRDAQVLFRADEQGYSAKEDFEMFGKDLGEEFTRQINEHEIYLHDASSIKNYCASITMYPFLQYGMTQLTGDSEAPKHLYSYRGSRTISLTVCLPICAEQSATALVPDVF